MSKRIERLTINKFKGSTCRAEIEFDKNKPTVLIFGENGTGKSTIVDAIDFACNGKFGSIDDKSVPQKSHTYLPSLGHTNSDIDIQLEYGGQKWRCTMGHDNKVNIAGIGAAPKANILRRAQILKFVNARAEKRYEAIATFISVPGCERSEDALRRAAKRVSDDYYGAVNAKLEAERTLQKLWTLEGKPEATYSIWAEAKAKLSTSELKKHVDFLEKLINEISSSKSSFEELTRSEGEHKQAVAEVGKAEQKFEEKQIESAPVDKALIGLLDQAKVYLENHVTDKSCPVCEQGVVASDLVARLGQRLSAIEKPRAAKNLIDNAGGIEIRKRAILETRTKDFIAKIRKLCSLVNGGLFQSLTGIVISENEYNRISNGADDISDHDLLPEAKLVWERINPYHHQLQKILNAKRTDLAQINALRTHVETIREKSETSTDYEKLAKKLDRLHKIVEAERKAYITEILTNVSDMIAKLYERLHPAEGLGRVRIYLKPNVKGSLELEADFQGRDVPPQAYYSDSHLDTLGVCVFLALAKYYNEDDTIVVLDDVITSVDQTHLERLMQLLHDEAANFNQIIITTHYRVWRDRYLFASGPVKNIQLLELLHWSIPRGIRSAKSKLSIEELEDSLKSAPVARQTIASLAGILLESLLDHITFKLRCYLPRQAEPNFTLGDLCGALSKKLKSVLKIEKIATTGAPDARMLADLIAPLEDTVWIRNWVGCHFNALGMAISDSEVVNFGNRTLELAKAMICDDCGQIPSRNKSGSYWECHCGKAKLYPLQLPT